MERLVDAILRCGRSRLQTSSSPDRRMSPGLDRTFSASAKPVTHSLKEFQIDVDNRKYSQLSKKGMVMGLAAHLPPGVVRMPVVVRDSSNGNMGTADLRPEGEQFHCA
jgi:hypothetical protein